MKMRYWVIFYFLFNWFLPMLLWTIFSLSHFSKRVSSLLKITGPGAQGWSIRCSLAWLPVSNRSYHRWWPFQDGVRRPLVSFWWSGCSKRCCWWSCRAFRSIGLTGTRNEAGAYLRFASCRYQRAWGKSQSFRGRTRSRRPPSRPWVRTLWTSGFRESICVHYGTSASGSW